MYISKLTLVNYKNFKNTSLRFHKGVNTIIGENGSGKSNILRAIRLLLDDNMVRSAYRLEEGDFSRSLDQWQGHWIIISMEFDEITTDESVQRHSFSTVRLPWTMGQYIRPHIISFSDPKKTSG